MREVIRDKGRIEHMLSAIGNVEEFTKDITIDDFVTVQDDLPILKEQLLELL